MEFNKGLISVIVPVYNTEEYLKECIDSILAQTYTNWELFLVDDGSTDNSGEICNAYAKQDERITVLHLENGRQGRARNRALEKNKGEYVCFVDSDDFIPNNALEIMLNGIEKAGVKLIQFASIKLEGKKEIFNFSHREYTEQNTFIALKNYITCNKEVVQHAPWAKLYKAELFKEIRFPEGIIYEDTATIYKLIELCDKVVYSPEVVYYVREREGSTTRQNICARNLDKLFVYEEMEKHFLTEYVNEELSRSAVCAQVDFVWNMAMQIYKHVLCKKEKAELIKILKQKGKALKKRGIYRDKKAKILLWAFLSAPWLFKLIIKICL